LHHGRKDSERACGSAAPAFNDGAPAFSCLDVRPALSGGNVCLKLRNFRLRKR